MIVRGLCMGAADVIPGVSGGTMAMLLGIYVRFIESIRGLNLGFVKPLFKWITSGFKKDRWQAVRTALSTMDLGFLVPLVIGIGAAFVVGSKFIPELMIEHPILMRAFFFGLVFASVAVPYKMMKARGASQAVVGVIFAVGAYLLVGLSGGQNDGWEVEEVVANGETVEELALNAPSALTPAQLLALDANEEALEALALQTEYSAEELLAFSRSEDPRHTAINDIVLPEGMTLSVPKPPYLFIFLCGLIAICAMVLPGVSGSFLLLALGSYFFMLNALKGFIKGMIHLSLTTDHIIYVGLFCTGALIGLLSFTRVLSWLFKRYYSGTLAAMTGLMIGCLRRLWPFQAEGANVLPDGFGGGVVSAIVACVAGIVLVVALNSLGGISKGEQQEA